MDKELEELRRTLRSLVVSSPTPVDVRTLTRDYRTLMGESLPLYKFGYRDCLTLLRERCSDCFLFQGAPSNPILTLIVPDSLKHIDKLVSKQRLGAKDKMKGKRWSVQGLRQPEPKARPSPARTPPTPPPPSRTPPTPSPARANHQPPPDDFGGPKLPMYNGRHGSESRGSHSESKDTDSGRMTSSSGARSEGGDRQSMLDVLAMQLIELLATHADGIWATELMSLYREKFGRELRVDRYGASSMTAFVRLLEGTAFHVRRPEPFGDWRLYNIRAPPPPENAPPPAPAACAATPPSARAQTPSPAPSPPPCAPLETTMSFLNSIRPADTADIECGQLLDVIVGEVYSPSHFWLLRYDNDHIVPLYATMDAMTHYYEGEGAALSLEAETEVRVGVHCAALYEGDWHRAIVARVLEDDTVVLRYLDYGTVGRAKVRDLKPLSLRWSKLPTQAIRARLVGLRPPARNRHWPISSSTKFLDLVRERPLVADVVAVDHEEGILEVYLVDTSTDQDVCINEQLLQQCFAEERRDSAFGDTASYLRPTFEALESGATPNFAEIVSLVVNDISLFCIEDYRRHVLDEPSPPPAPHHASASLHASTPSPVPHHASMLLPVSASSAVPHHTSTTPPALLHASAPSPVPHHAPAPSPVPHHRSMLLPVSASSAVPHHTSTPPPALPHAPAPSPVPHHASMLLPVSASSAVPHHTSTPPPALPHASAPSPVPHHAPAPSPVPHHAPAPSPAPYYASASNHESAHPPAPLYTLALRNGVAPPPGFHHRTSAPHHAPVYTYPPPPLHTPVHPPAPLHAFALPPPPAPLHAYAPPTAAHLPHAPLHAPVALRTGPEMRISAPSPPNTLYLSFVHCQTYVKLMVHDEIEAALFHIMDATNRCSPAEAAVSLAPDQWTIFMQLMNESRQKEAAIYIENLLRTRLGAVQRPPQTWFVPKPPPSPYFVDPAVIASQSGSAPRRH